MKHGKILQSAAAALIFFAAAVLSGSAQIENNSSPTASGTPPAAYSIRLDKETIARGYTVSAFSGSLKLSLVPGILNDSTAVESLQLDEGLAMPWKLQRLSPVYQFEFKNKKAYADHLPFYIQIAYPEKSARHKQVFYYDKNFSAWRPLPSKDYQQENFIRSRIHLPYARVAVFGYPDTLTQGRASWYSHKAGNFAASPDYPAGSVLRVKNLANGKTVDVSVNDYGPDRAAHPDRAIDLEKNAFKKISSLSEGVISVSIEPIKIAALSKNSPIYAPPEGIGSEPEIISKSGIIFDSDSGKLLWEKNSQSALPLASLSKMMAVYVFLQTEPDLGKVVAYSAQDEKYNLEYAKIWESARLRIGDNETLTIKDLIFTSLVGSANNTIETLVRQSGLGRDQFIAKMNALAASWGASSTKFVEPTGLSPQNVSSARDYAIITREVLKTPLIVAASTAKQYEFRTISANAYHKIKNTNRLIASGKYRILGSKTGYLDEAGYCLMVKAASKNKRNIIVVVFGSGTRDDNFAETEMLMKYGLMKLESNI